MQQYILRRLAALALNLFFVSLFTFTALRLVPGDITGEVLGQSATNEQRLAFKQQHGLNDPALVQYLRWVTGVLSGDLGKSLRSNTSVTSGFLDRIPVTLEIVFFSFFFTTLLGVAFGIAVGPNANAMHGQAAAIEHDGEGVLAGLPSPFAAGRYHALAAAEPADDSELVVSARLKSGLIMGLRHRTLPIEGVQFHPESVLTPLGYRILANTARQAGYTIDDAVIDDLVADALRVTGA